MVDPVTIVALSFAAVSIATLVKPLVHEVTKKFRRGEAQKIRISITDIDGTVKSIEVPGAKSKAVTEEQLKKLVELLGEADDGSK